MFPLLVLLFIVVPIVELYVIVQVAGGIGVLETIGLLIVVSVVGAWLVRREGLGVLRKVQTQLAAGEMPTKQIVDGGLIMFAGALMLTPGFVTDAVGVLLLIPPTRIAVRTILMRRFRGRIQTVGPSAAGFGGPFGAGFGTGPVYDVRGTEQVDLERDDAPNDPPPALP
ncbi:MAG: FxsA family protein [Actinomycetota bacterium]